MKLIKFIILNIIIIGLFISCSQSKMLQLTSKSVDIEYQKPDNYSKLNEYQKDAVYLINLIKQTYPRLSSKIPEKEFEYQAIALINDLENIDNDFNFQMRINKFLAILKDAHTFINVNYPQSKRFFYFLYKEKENWIIGNIDKTVDSMVIGSKIISINNMPIKEIETVINQFQWGENSFYRLEMFRQWPLIIPEYWEAIGVCEKGGNLSFTTSNNNVEYNFVLERKVSAEEYNVKITDREYPFTKKQNDGFYYKIDKSQNFAYLQMNTSLDYVSYKNGIKEYTNIITRPIVLAYLKRKTKDARDFGKTLQHLFNNIQKDSITNLIIDLRNNEGGDERTGKQLIWYLTDREDIKGFTRFEKDFQTGNSLSERPVTEPYFDEITKKDSPYFLDKSIPKFKGKVFVLIGVHTFSAGQVLATTIADNKLATVIGQPTGNKPTTQTVVSNIKLPETKMIVHISNAFIERPDTTKNDEIALYPEIEIYPTFNDFINGKDVQFEYIINTITE